MALVDLTNFNPYEQTLRAQREAGRVRSAALQNSIQNLQRGLEVSLARRHALQAQNQQFRDREYALISNETNKLVQPQTGSKITDVKLQELGRQMKTEYYDAVKAYQASDKSDEARQQFETAKQKALQSARVVSGSIDKLDAQVELFRSAAAKNQISDATDPAIRDFMADLQDKNLDPNQYQIVPDEQTGQLRYVGKTSNGYDVDFSLDDIANGDNGFSPMAKPDMAKTIQNLMKDVTKTKKQVKTDWGIAEVTDWNAIGQAIDGRLDELLDNDPMFRSIAAEEGFGYEALKSIEEQGSWVDPNDGVEYTSLQQVKDEVKKDIMQTIENVTPHEETRAYVKPEFREPSPKDKAQAEELREVQQGINNQIITAAGKKDLEYFRSNLLGRIPKVDDMKLDGDKLIMYSYTSGGKASPVHVYDLGNVGDVQRLAELAGGNRDLASMESNIINF